MAKGKAAPEKSYAVDYRASRDAVGIVGKLVAVPIHGSLLVAPYMKPISGEKEGVAVAMNWNYALYV